jgi:hypothetical protein
VSGRNTVRCLKRVEILSPTRSRLARSTEAENEKQAVSIADDAKPMAYALCIAARLRRRHSRFQIHRVSLQ